MRVDTRGEAQQHVRALADFGEDGIESIEFIEAVDNDVMNPDVDRPSQLGDRLVVAMQRQPVGGHTGG